VATGSVLAARPFGRLSRRYGKDRHGAPPDASAPAALDAGLPRHVREVQAAAPTYPEGRAVHLPIASDEDVASLITLVAVRMAG
jgi:hypothetical protein